jgi:DNA-binding CsgD family transcriptional regulator
MQQLDVLQQGREGYASQEWAATSAAFSAADDRVTLQPGDLEMLATAQFMLGRQEDYFATLERAHRAYLDRADAARAGMCAFWIGMHLFMSGEVGRGGGWLARAQRAVDEADGDCVERGYLMMPQVYRLQAAGDVEGALATVTAAAEVGRRLGNDDLAALATHAHGLLLIEGGRVPEGLAFLDEAMLMVTAGEVSPIPTGIIYCAAIGGCRTAFDPRRAQEWTNALHGWCERQPDLLAFTGDCHLDRADLMQLHGAWDQALSELDRAAGRAQRAGSPRVAASAAYRRGEILRLRGDLAGAERAFREAARGGHEPQPGLALLRLAQGDTAAASGAIRRTLEETEAPSQRAGLLAACVEILLGAGDLEAAAAACDELEGISAQRASEQLCAMVAHRRGAVELAAGRSGEALPHLRRALAGWVDLDAPYEAARVRLMIAQACSTLGDDDSAALDREAALDALARLGATGGGRATHGLTAREREVLHMVAAGHTNRAIADALVLSERTVDRHVSNILAKLRVPSRAAATAYAYEHHLL